jgi:hypothetical protein
VPACQACNDAKGRLEHYLTAVLPFGGRHTDAATSLAEFVPPRLARNAALHKHLSQGRQRVWAREGNLAVPVTTLPVDSLKIEALFRYIVKGLVWHHWQVLLSAETGVWAGGLTNRGVDMHRRLLATNARQRASANLGNGTFVYDGAQGTDIPDMSIWLFSMFGGIKLSGDPDAPSDETTLIGGITVTYKTLAKLDALGITSAQPPAPPKPSLIIRP